MYLKSKTDEEILESIIGFEALYKSLYKCKKGVLWKNQPAHFYLNGIEEILKLEEQLKNGTYKPRKPRTVKITYPKPREALANSFRDRIYQRSLNDNVLYPTMTHSFIDDNAACQSGKGPDWAMNRLDKFLRQAFRKYGLDIYVMQGDIHGYYPNMSHQKTEEKFKEKVPKVAYKMTIDVLRYQYKGDKGYNPGSQLVQIAGISYLDEFDHYVKEQLHIRWYIRYMDDFILIHPNLEYLNECKRKITKYMEKLECELHPKKTKVYHISDSIGFLGFYHKLTETGKVVRLIDPVNVKHERLKLRREVALVTKGKMKKQKVDEGYRCWKAHASKGNSIRLIQRMDAYYKSLWKENKYD